MASGFVAVWVGRGKGQASHDDESKAKKVGRERLRAKQVCKRNSVLTFFFTFRFLSLALSRKGLSCAFSSTHVRLALLRE